MTDNPTQKKLFSAGCAVTLKGSAKDFNEDCVVFYEKEPEGAVGGSNFYVLTDGVSGTYRPDVSATFTARKIMYDYFRSTDYVDANKIAIAIRNANNELMQYAQSQHQDMQAVVSAISVTEGRSVIGTIGDSRVYILRNGNAYKMTEDQVTVTEHGRTVVNTIGYSDDIIVDILDAIELKADDIIIMCSDGLLTYAGKSEFLEVANAGNPKEIAEGLMRIVQKREPTVDVSIVVIKIYDEDTIHSVVRQPGTVPDKTDVNHVVKELDIYRASHPVRKTTLEGDRSPRSRTPLKIVGALLAAILVLALVWFFGDSSMGGKIFGPRETATPTIDPVQATLQSIQATEEMQLLIQLSYTPTATMLPTETPTPEPTATETPEPTATEVIETEVPEDLITPTVSMVMKEPVTSEKDGSKMVYVPAGTFLLGADGTTDAMAIDAEEGPQLTVYLDGFWIDQHEITNLQYRQCVTEGGCTIGQGMSIYQENLKDYPVTYVSALQAEAYCTWAGKTLPNELQWEKAARGTDGRIYPWGDEAPDGNNLYANNPALTISTGKGVSGVYPVGSFPDGASPYGALDMAGNVWEWTSSMFDAGYYQKLADAAGGADQVIHNPADESVGMANVIRGGSASDLEINHYQIYMRTTNRAYVNMISSYYIGFRCVLADTE